MAHPCNSSIPYAESSGADPHFWCGSGSLRCGSCFSLWCGSWSRFPLWCGSETSFPKWCRFGPATLQNRHQIRIIFSSWIRIFIKVKIQNVLKAQNRAVEGCGRSQWRPGGWKWSPGGCIDQWLQISITSFQWKAGSGSAFKWKAGSGSGSSFKWVRIRNPD